MRHHRHVFVCVQHRPLGAHSQPSAASARSGGGGKPACGDRGGCEILARVEILLIGPAAAGARVAATGSQCLGPCFDGPNAVVYPDGAWYGGLAPDDAAGLVAHLVDGVALAGKRLPDDGG